jgi:hypothetical protein
MSGRILLTLFPTARGHARHKEGQFHQVRDPEQRAALPHDNLGIGSDDVGPLRRNRTDCAVVEAQQQTPAGSIKSLADTNGTAAAKRVEGVGYNNTLRGSEGNACTLQRVTSGWNAGGSSGRHRPTA